MNGPLFATVAGVTTRIPDVDPLHARTFEVTTIAMSNHGTPFMVRVQPGESATDKIKRLSGNERILRIALEDPR